METGTVREAENEDLRQGEGLFRSSPWVLQKKKSWFVPLILPGTWDSVNREYQPCSRRVKEWRVF